VKRDGMPWIMVERVKRGKSGKRTHVESGADSDCPAAFMCQD
jgi:hypothetical protein